MDVSDDTILEDKGHEKTELVCHGSGTSLALTHLDEISALDWSTLSPLGRAATMGRQVDEQDGILHIWKPQLFVFYYLTRHSWHRNTLALPPLASPLSTPAGPSITSILVYAQRCRSTDGKCYGR